MKSLATLVITFITLILLTFTAVLYGEGWRIRFSNSSGIDTSQVVIKTGMLAVRSIPEGAKVYLNGKDIGVLGKEGEDVEKTFRKD